MHARPSLVTREWEEGEWAGGARRYNHQFGWSYARCPRTMSMFVECVRLLCPPFPSFKFIYVERPLPLLHVGGCVLGDEVGTLQSKAK